MIGTHTKYAKKTDDILDCGGKRSATPLLSARENSVVRWPAANTKAPSPLTALPAQSKTLL
jgi:hypothetical protein